MKAVIWALTALATVLLVGRLLIRGTLLKGFHLDDVFCVTSHTLLLAIIILATVANPLNYRFSAIIVGESPMPEPAVFADMTVTPRKWNVSAQALFWTALYCVKLSFMFLYRTVLGSSSGKRTKGWWVVLAFVVICYGICISGVWSQCGDAKNLFKFAECNTPYVASYFPRSL